MEKLEYFEKLLRESESVSYADRERFDLIWDRAKMYVRKFFGDDSHYLVDFERVVFSPPIIISGIDNDFAYYFESGLKQFRIILKVIIEDIKLSTNYPESRSATGDVSSEVVVAGKKIARDGQNIQVFIASPSDAILERTDLMNSLETKFRKGGFEAQCGKRILVKGWEDLPTQTGYGQDVINEQLLSQVDIVLAVFRHKLGTPTLDPVSGIVRAKSGTAEELLYAINGGGVSVPPLGMAYFYSEAPSMSFEAMGFEDALKEWDRLKKFKVEIKDKVLYKEYRSKEELLATVCTDLAANIRSHFV